MDIHDTFPSQNRFHQSMWASWLSKIKEGEERDEEYIEKQKKEILNFYKSDEWKKSGIDLGGIVEDEAWQLDIVYHNMYAALIVSIWSKCEHFLQKISSLAKEQLNMTNTIKFDFKSQQDFFHTHLGISLPPLADFDYMNAIRILNNTYKHSGGVYSEDQKKTWDNLAAPIANSWEIRQNAEINYTVIPIAELVEHAHNFFDKLHEKVRKEVDTRRPAS